MKFIEVHNFNMEKGEDVFYINIDSILDVSKYWKTGTALIRSYGIDSRTSDLICRETVNEVMQKIMEIDKGSQELEKILNDFKVMKKEEYNSLYERANNSFSITGRFESGEIIKHNLDIDTTNIWRYKILKNGKETEGNYLYYVGSTTEVGVSTSELGLSLDEKFNGEILTIKITKIA